MKKTVLLALSVALVMAFGFIPCAGAAVSAGIAVNPAGNASFYFAISSYNKVPENEVIVVKKRGIPDEELPVVFFVASKANVNRDEIVRLRLKKWSWMRIIRKYRIDPSVFYVPVKEQVKTGPYGVAYGYYQNKPQNKWRHIKLSDAEVMNFVNLKFMSEHYGHDPVKIMKLREGGKRFWEIHDDLYVIKHKKFKDMKAIKNRKKFEKRYEWQKEKHGDDSYQQGENMDGGYNEGDDGRGHGHGKKNNKGYKYFDE